MYVCMYVCVSVLGDDDPVKGTIYHVTWLPLGDKAFTSITVC